jgi:hypothetical protein
MYSAWVSGCAVVMLTKDEIRSGPELVEILREAEVTVLFCPPVLLTSLTANPETEIGLWEFAGAGVMIQKPTVKTEELTKRISRMFPSQSNGGVMLEALVDASKELGKKPAERRRVIVSVSLNSPETSTMEARECAMAMKKANVAYWAIAIQANADANTSSNGGSPVRELIMDNVTAATGGLRLSGVTPTSLEQQLKSVADALLSQYLVTYARPSGAPAPTSIQAYSKKGLCPKGYPVAVPQIMLIIQYPIANDTPLQLASFGQITGHADFFNGWSPPELKRLVDYCLNALRACGAVS